MLPISPELAFRQTANKAAAIQNAPLRFVRYHVTTHVRIPTYNRERDYQSDVVTRISDDRSLITDNPPGTPHLEEHAFPVVPTFNALSDFSYNYGMNLHKIWFQVTSSQPRTYRTPAALDADITATSLRDYRVGYATDSNPTNTGITHLVLDPYPWYRKQASYYFKDVWIDNASGLPSKIAFEGVDHLGLSFTYTTVAGQWAVKEAYLEQDIAAPFHLGRVHFFADAVFNAIEFLDASPVKELEKTSK